MKQNLYDDPAFFAGYAELRRTESGLNAVLEQPALHSLLPSLAGKRVLDLGCGFGDFCRRAHAQEAAAITGVDLSERMLEVARERTPEPTGIRYLRASLEEYQHTAASVDVVVSSLALHYIEDYADLVRRVHEWLAPGGVFVFSVEHPLCTALLSGWHKDTNGVKQFWPVDRYREEGIRESHWFVDGVQKYHRTVETYVNTLLDAGLIVTRLLEPAPCPEFLAARPDLKEELRRPPFLLLSARVPSA